MSRTFILLGGGGLGRELLTVLRGLPAYHRGDFKLRGLLDSRTDPALFAPLGIPCLASPYDFVPEPDDEILVAVGDVAMRAAFVASLQSRHARFGGYVVDERTLGERSSVGSSVISRSVRVSSDSHIGDFVYIDSDATIGHDVTIGACTHIGSRAFIAGNVRIGERVNIHPCAAIASGVEVGDDAVIGMGAVVLKNVPPRCTVFGNPARVIFTQPDKEAP